MRLENSFEVSAPVDRVWPFLLDVERVVPCMPGAELTETIDEANWKGRVKIKVGPVALQFIGTVRMVERDTVNRSLALKAKGMEQRGRGAATATITSTLEATDDHGTRVVLVQDLSIQGQAAQISRGMLPEVTAKLTQQFADCIRANLEAKESDGPKATQTQAAREIKVIPLGARWFWTAIKRFFKRIFDKESS